MRGKALMAIIEGIPLIIIGIYALIVNLSNSFENQHFINSADNIVAECVGLCGDTDNNNRVYSKIFANYKYNGLLYQNIVVDTHDQLILQGEKFDLYVSPDNPSVCAMRYNYFEGKGETLSFLTFIGLGIGSLLVAIGIRRSRTGNYWGNIW